MTLAPGTQLGPYKIVSQLGSGGMGVVYEATDPRLKRTVAIKLLPPDLTKDNTSKQRFLQEAQAASALDHPNICTIHEINETDDGQLYLVMAAYEGETLKERIERGPLDLDDAIDIAAQVGQGLAEAHGAGIVHRDIKPANLFVTKSGVVKILDFGLAKLAGSEGVTQTGTAVGTVAYMSPEQARGREVDHRTDIWSLGVVLYEMLAGTPPFQGENLLSLADAIRSYEPQPVSGVASYLDPTVSRALNKDAAQRYQAATELVNDLRTGSSTPATVVTRSGEPDTPSIAVLPFADMSPEKDQDYFCEGMAEEIIDALTKLDGLRVVARTSAFQFKGQASDLRDVGAKLNVKTVLEGSVRKAGSRLRVTAQLINTEDGYHLWSERYDRELDDVFAVQDEIARTVVEKLKVRLLRSPTASLVTHEGNLEAYQSCLRGRHFVFKGTPGALKQALECFEKALAARPDYARALVGIGTVYAWQAAMGVAAPRDVMPQAKEAALKAVEIDDSAAVAHYGLSGVLLWYDWEWLRAEDECRRAIALNAGFADAHTDFALLLSFMGRHEEALPHAKRGIDLDPLGLHAATALSTVLCFARRFNDALAQARQALELEPAYLPALWALADAHAALGDYEAVLEVCDRGSTVAEDETMLETYRGWACGRLGRTQEAENVVERFQQRRHAGQITAHSIARCFEGLGDVDRAVEWLNRAREDRELHCVFLNRSPWYDSLRSDHRFQALLRKMNFPRQSES